MDTVPASWYASHMRHLVIKLDDPALVAAIDRIRAAGSHHSRTAAVRAAVLSADPGSGADGSVAPLLDALEALSGPEGITAAEVLSRPWEALAELRAALADLGRYLSPTGTSSHLGSLLRTQRGRRDAEGRYLDASRGNNGVVRWYVARG